MPEHKLNLSSCSTKLLYRLARKAELFMKNPMHLDKERMSEPQKIMNELEQANMAAFLQQGLG